MILEIKTNRHDGIIDFNYEEILDQLKSIKDKVSCEVDITEQTIAEFKDKRAMLNSMSKNFKEYRDSIKDEVSKPITDKDSSGKSFTDKIVNLIDTVVSYSKDIDVKIKEFEDKLRELKKEEIEKVFDEYKDKIIFEGESVGEAYLLAFMNEQCVRKNRAWLNKTVSMASIRADFDEEVERVNKLCVFVSDSHKDKDEEYKIYSKSCLILSRFNLDVYSHKMREFVEANNKVVNMRQSVEKKVETELSKKVVANKNEKRYTCTIKFVGTEESMAGLKQFLDINKDIAYKVISSMKEVE
jgi:hypothetical protein